MVNPLYYIINIVFVLILVIILHHDRKVKSSLNKQENAYRLLVYWVIFFCLQDAVWGYLGGGGQTSDVPFFISSSVFHLSTVVTTFFWLYYILEYLSDRIHFRKVLLWVDVIVMFLQLVLVVMNFFTPTIFTIENGVYVPAYLRPLAFFNQYIVYLSISIITFICLLAANGHRREKYGTVFMFSLAPVLSGVFQAFYPNEPYFSIGYFLGCFIIHMYVVTNDRDELKRLQAAREMKEQVKISNTDELTGLWNRRFYETNLQDYPNVPTEDNFVFLSIDINGLKAVNDTLGHEAGDELIVGASDCLKKCLGAYGRIFRIGGDEFVAIMFATEDELKSIKKDLDETIHSWRGHLVRGLAMSYGFVSKREYPELTVREIARIADERMYADKEIYYSRKGVDRRGQQFAFSALCASYTKILKINLSDDKYRIIRMDQSEQTADKGFSSSISTWLHDFGTSGQVHADDLENYLSLTNIAYMQAFFRSHNLNLNIFYRRKSGDTYRQTKMEMIPAEDFSDENMSLYLYVKDIDI